MTVPASDRNWRESNHRYLSTALAATRIILERHIARARDEGDVESHDRKLEQARHEMQNIARLMPAPPALDTLCASFGLSPFEREIILLCAGAELDSAFAPLFAAAQGDINRAYPTFSLALAALDNPHWSAIKPDTSLRYLRLVEVGAGNALTLSPLRIDECILHYLSGLPYTDERLTELIKPVEPAGELAPSHRSLAERLVSIWLKTQDKSPMPIVQLCGDEFVGKRAIARAACDALDLNLNWMPVHFIPGSPGEIEALVRLWERKVVLDAGALLMEYDNKEMDAGLQASTGKLIDLIGGPLILSSRERQVIPRRTVIALDVHKPTSAEQSSLWHSALGAEAGRLDGKVDLLVSQFNLSAAIIRSASVEALGRLASENDPDLSSSDGFGEVLWDICRVQVRPHLDALAQHLEPVATWDDFVLPEAQRHALRDISTCFRQRAKVYETWGFADKGKRGLGLSALFAGASGTGKTMAAEVLASDLRLDLYRIDLSQVVSKYIGETEKNLRRVFDAAEEGGAILLFDEADALFGKRSEVKDSHDRYANIEISYLLQRMESYRGLAILTTNMKDVLDPAFLRRIRFVIQFPFPDAAQRAEIWRRIYPDRTPTENLNIDRLSQLNVAGGNIRNIALYAAFLAADAGKPVCMSHLLYAARAEYAKMERPLTDAEIGGWV